MQNKDIPVILAIKIVSIVLALITSLRLKINLSLTVFSLSLYTVVLFQVKAQTALISAGLVLVEQKTLQLFVIIAMVLYVAAVQKSKNMFDRLVSSLNAIIRDPRVVALVAPAIVGFLPMPGGALVSAPLVEASTKNMNLKPEFNTFINYWFRHIWEFIWPVYTSLLIFQALSGIPLKTIILYQAPFTILNIATGIIITFMQFKKHNIKRPPPGETASLSQTAMDFFEGIWPILLVTLFFFILFIPLHISLVLVALLLTVVKRVTVKGLVDALFSKTVGKTLLLIANIMIFKRIIDISGAFNPLQNMDVSLSMAVLFSFLVSFTMGFLTGINNAFIIIAYPILLPLLQHFTGDRFIFMSLYVYIIGLAGILLSPLHLCLVLTNEYFKSSLYGVYKYLALPGIMLCATATVLVLVL